MRKLTGLPAAPGIASGPAHWISRAVLDVEQGHADDPRQELERLEQALRLAETDLDALRLRAEQQVGKDEAQIFLAQRAILRDPELQSRVRKSVEGEGVNVEFAWQEGIRFYARMLRGIADEYLSARAADVEDVGRRVLALLSGQSSQTPKLEAPSIILAEELTPAETVLLDRGRVLAFCTQGGGPTSHVAILSRALGVPCIVGLGAGLASVQNGMPLLVDGTAGQLLIEPDERSQSSYAEMAGDLEKFRQDAIEKAGLSATTLDGRPVKVVANIGSLADAGEAIKSGAEGVGLLRTEFLFLDRATAPDEEEQVQAYAAIFNAIGKSKPIVVRTLDIGGDKPASYIHTPKENNPFLGLRGLRLSLRFQDLFEIQLRSLLRAGAGYDLRIMFPMVSSLEEFLKAREISEQCLQALASSGQAHNENPQLGIMVEVPSAALTAQAFAGFVDFFSIGTNDLSQYTLAAERTSAQVASIADPLHPSVLQLIRGVIEAAHAKGKWVGLCGELAGDPIATPVLLGLELDEFSASPRSIPVLKQTIRAHSAAEGRGIAQRALELTNAAEVRALLESIAGRRTKR